MAVTLVLLFVIGTAIGGLSGALGVGGGFLLIPALVLIGGLDQHTAHGTSLLAIVPISVYGVTSLRRRGLGKRVGRGLSLGVIGVAGSVVASQLAVRLVPGHALRLAFAGLLVLVGLQMLRGARSTP